MGRDGRQPVKLGPVVRTGGSGQLHNQGDQGDQEGETVAKADLPPESATLLGTHRAKLVEDVKAHHRHEAEGRKE